MSERPTAYDVVAYPGHPLPQTHPAHLAAIARLHGVGAASPTAARVLELGCGTGGNLLPLALSYPGGEFVGIDLAPTAVEQGERARREVGLTNVRFHAADVCDLPADLGSFDYVIAHGLFSWVPDPVRRAILACCRDRLAPAGVAYISYNAYPGGHVRQMLRQMMRFHVRDIPDPGKQVEQALALLHFLTTARYKPGPLSEVFRSATLKGVFDKSPAVVFHDDLADVNDPFSITDFMALASGMDLQFLGEADYHELENRAFPPDAAAMLDGLGERDVIRQEQYRDFITLRQFRQTLLVRSDQRVVRPACPAVVRELAATADLQTESPDLAGGVAVRFKGATGAVLTLDHSLAKAALIELTARYPAPLGFADLVAAAADRTGRPPDAVPERDREIVAEVLLDAFRVGLVALQVDPPRFAPAPGERPVASPLARFQLAGGSTQVTNLRHSVIALESALTRQFVSLLDGTRDRAALQADLLAWARSGQPDRAEPEPEPDPDWLEKKILHEFDEGLRMAARMALLMPSVEE